MAVETGLRRPAQEKPSGTSSRPRLMKRLSILILVFVYVPMALAFSLLTRAYEADDETAHLQNIEHIVRHHSLPRIAVANGLESHQPPLYYLVAAGWQELLGIRAFTPVVVGASSAKTTFGSIGLKQNRLLYSTHYSSSQHRDAVHVHELRLLSIPFGLATVLFTYAAAKVIGLRERLALASGLFVAFLPKNLVASMTITNDALVVPLCALALLLYLLSERALAQKRLFHRRLHLVAMGATLGAAVITKLNSLPIAVVLLVLAALPSQSGLRRSLSRPWVAQGEPTPNVDADESLRHNPVSAIGAGLNARLILDVVLALVGFFAVSGWWFLRNHHLYGQYLATKASERYLGAWFLHPVPWNSHLFFHVFPHALLTSSWYNQPNFGLPLWMNQTLAVAVVLSLVVGLWAILRERQWFSRIFDLLSRLSFLGCSAAGIAAMLLIIKTNSIGDMRDALVAISAFAIAITVGSARAFGRISPRLEMIGVGLWPVALLGLDFYVLIRFLIPLGGL
jgi:hypothetical protein